MKAGAIYFVLVFGAGFLLGLVRIPFLVPSLGERVAELLELPFMLVVIFFAAGYVVRRFNLASSPTHAVGVGLLALAFLLAAELLVTTIIAGSSITEYISGRDPISGSAYVISLLVYAAMPWLQARRDKANPWS